MFTLDEVVPWGRSLEEYRRMFALSDTDLQRRIVDDTFHFLAIREMSRIASEVRIFPLLALGGNEMMRIQRVRP
jgi:hypothetical protein